MEHGLIITRNDQNDYYSYKMLLRLVLCEYFEYDPFI